MKVSIIVTNYNYGKFISRCLRSCISQNFEKKDYEIIVVDDNLHMQNVEANKKFGKGRMIHELMKSIGIPLYIDGYHMGWVWEEVV